jgi:hypothetical protein
VKNAAGRTGVSDTEHQPQVSSHRYPAGTRVEVRSRFDGTWANGFEVAEAVADGYRVRRLSDGTLLPAVFDDDEVRRERRRETWWI